MTSQNAYMTSRFSVLASAGPHLPLPCCHLANDSDLLDLSAAMDKKCCHQASANEMSNSTGSNFDNNQTDLWPADPFTRIDPKFNQVVPENFMQIGPAIFL